MFDAEIAATLLNRWEHEQPAVHSHSPLELLCEGKLPFSRQIGKIWAVPVSGESGVDIECLIFADGSRALRLWHTGADSGWTRWAPIEPIGALLPTDCCPV
ncbi:MAG TPA: hypothetical protein VNZ04_14220 [Trinickia sp.]|jgi:hypothetical protein|nr:hypothetical protein [Trinickia sp.]